MLVSGPGAPAVAKLDDLSGKKVNVRQASSYLESLNALNEKLGGASKPRVQIVTMPDALEDEDVLEMLNAGLFDFTVVDSRKAKLWAQTVPQIRMHEDIVLRSGERSVGRSASKAPNFKPRSKASTRTRASRGSSRPAWQTIRRNSARSRKAPRVRR